MSDAIVFIFNSGDSMDLHGWDLIKKGIGGQHPGLCYAPETLLLLVRELKVRGLICLAWKTR